MEIPIQVAVQIYPGYPNDPCCIETSNYIDNNGNNISMGLPHMLPSSGIVRIINGQQSSFSVTHALPYDCSQEYVYRQTVYPLIAMFLEGYDASIVTYGQHNTGKTYLMYGPGLDCVYSESVYGIVQRAVRDIFTQLTQRHRERTFVINVGWIEVCGNEIHDILGGRSVQCVNITDVFQCIQKGMANRNQEASHSIFTLTLEQQWVNSDGLIQHLLSTATFCDLCGTERMYTINNLNQQISVPKDQGLQALERVVSMLCTPQNCPVGYNYLNVMNYFDDTTLTKLLKDSFGGRSQTLFILCVSPLEQDLAETIQNLEFAYKVQFIRNIVKLNTFSDNNLPISTFIYPDGVNLNNDVPNINQDTLSLKFAASQWLKLVSNAEGLFSKLLVNSKHLNEEDRECIEEWMYLKHECEECLSSGEFVANQRLLGPIQEADELDESNEIDYSLPKTNQTNQIVSIKESLDNQKDSTLNSMITDNESDLDEMGQQNEFFEERIMDLMAAFTVKTNEMIDNRYEEFLRAKAKPVTRSIDESSNSNKKYQNKGRRSSLAAIYNTDTMNDNQQHDRGRRKSIQPGSSGDGLAISRADMERLHQVAKNSEREKLVAIENVPVCPEAAEFLESSNDMHPLRTANAHKTQDTIQSNIRKLVTDFEAKQEQITELQHTIALKRQLIEDLIKNSETRTEARKRFNQKREKLQIEKDKCEKQLKLLANSRNTAEIIRLKSNIELLNQRQNDITKIKQITAEADQKIKELRQSIQESKKQMHTLSKSSKKDKKLLETLEIKLEQEKTKELKDAKYNAAAAASNVDTRITHLNYVLEAKAEKLSQGEGEKEQLIRHEIRNLRCERERLVNDMERKWKKDKSLSRQMLECEVAIEVIDSAIEFKNELICGRHTSGKSNQHTNDTIERIPRPKVIGQQLIEQLNKLTEKEMRTLLYKCLHKIIDLRDSGRELEFQILQLEREREEWKLRECTLYNAIRQSRLEGERDTLNLIREQEATLTLLLQVAVEDSGTSSNGAALLNVPARSDLLQLIPSIRDSQRRTRYLNETTALFNNASSSSSSKHHHGYHHHHHHHHNDQKIVAVTTATTINTNATSVATAAASASRRTDLDAYALTTGQYMKPLDKQTKVNKNFLSSLKNRVCNNTSNDKRNPTSVLMVNPLPTVTSLPESKVAIVKNKLYIQQNK